MAPPDPLSQTLPFSTVGNSTSTMNIGMSLNSILALNERISTAPATLTIPQNISQQQQQQQLQLQSRKSSAGTVRSNASYLLGVLTNYRYLL